MDQKDILSLTIKYLSKNDIKNIRLVSRQYTNLIEQIIPFFMRLRKHFSNHPSYLLSYIYIERCYCLEMDPCRSVWRNEGNYINIKYYVKDLVNNDHRLKYYFDNETLCLACDPSRTRTISKEDNVGNEFHFLILEPEDRKSIDFSLNNDVCRYHYQLDKLGQTRINF